MYSKMFVVMLGPTAVIWLNNSYESCLNLIMAQRLVRTIGQDSKEQYKPTAEELKMAGFPKNKVNFQKCIFEKIYFMNENSIMEELLIIYGLINMKVIKLVTVVMDYIPQTTQKHIKILKII